MITLLIVKQGINNYVYNFFYQLFNKMPYLEKSNMVVLRYGKNDPPALVLILPTIKNPTSCSTLIKSTTSLPLSVMTSAVSDVVALISISPFNNKLIVLSFKAYVVSL